jgi:hypothetical protein
MTKVKPAVALASLIMTALVSPAQAFEAEFSGRFGYSETGGILVFGRTNLPEGLRFTVTMAGDHFRAKQVVAVEDGQILAGPFQIEKSGLPPGTYRLTVNAGVAEGQPAAVREVIGENWDAVTSEYITVDAQGRRRFAREIDFTVD